LTVSPTAKARRQAVCALLEDTGFKVAEAIGGNNPARVVRC
jgi:hypothetical protein